MTGLIHQSEEDRKSYDPEIQPDFVLENLRAAYNFIEQQKEI